MAHTVIICVRHDLSRAVCSYHPFLNISVMTKA